MLVRRSFRNRLGVRGIPTPSLCYGRSETAGGICWTCRGDSYTSSYVRIYIGNHVQRSYEVVATTCLIVQAEGAYITGSGCLRESWIT